MTRQLTKARYLVRKLFSCVGLVLILTITLSLSTASHAQNSKDRSKAELEQLVAPIALYSDDLLSQVLMASTYPLEVVEAARWTSSNKDVSGKALEEAMATQAWDASVKALTTVPQTLQMMNDKIDWTQRLGDAFLAQQKDVLDAVQILRQRADAAGNLKTTPQQKVTKISQPSQNNGTPQQAITIAQADPEMSYVPVYDPNEVYGAWPYADYAPFSWYPYGYSGGRLFGFGAGLLTGAAIWGGVDWWRRDVNINPLRYNQFNRTNITDSRWQHRPEHRRGVAYRDSSVAQKFGNANRNAAREQFRGKADAGRQNLTNRSNSGGGNPKATNLKNTNKATTSVNKAKTGNARNAKGHSAGRNAKATQRPTGQRAAAHGSRNRSAGNIHNANRMQSLGHQAGRARAQAIHHGGGGRSIYGGGARMGAMHGGGFRGGGGMRGGGGRRR
jgi:hypothetical protein